jgi:hypothetical protein
MQNVKIYKSKENTYIDKRKPGHPSLKRDKVHRVNETKFYVAFIPVTAKVDLR